MIFLNMQNSMKLAVFLIASKNKFGFDISVTLTYWHNGLTIYLYNNKTLAKRVLQVFILFFLFKR